MLMQAFLLNSVCHTLIEDMEIGEGPLKKDFRGRAKSSRHENDLNLLYNVWNVQTTEKILRKSNTSGWLHSNLLFLKNVNNEIVV